MNVKSRLFMLLGLASSEREVPTIDVVRIG